MQVRNNENTDKHHYIHPIRSDEEHAEALAEIDRLWDAAEGTPEADRLEVLAMLVDAYEEVHHPVEPPDPVAAILFRMEQQGLTRKDLEPYLGPRSRVSEVLSHKRSLSISMIRRLHEGLGIPAEVLIRESHLTA